MFSLLCSRAMSCRHLVLCLPGIYGLMISLIGTCLFTRAFTDLYPNLLNPLSSFDYPRTYVELYFLLLFNAAVLILFSLVSPCKSSSELKAVVRLRLILILFELLLYGYSLSKFLIFYEWTNIRNSTSPRSLDRFDISNMIFLPLSALGAMFTWIFFVRHITSRPIEQSADPERQPLIVNSDEQRSYTESTSRPDEPTVQIIQHKSAWWRIIQLGKEEWRLYIVAFTFLLMAAASKTIFGIFLSMLIFCLCLAEIFQPLFSGHIISSVAASDWHQFTVNVFWYLGISFA